MTENLAPRDGQKLRLFVELTLPQSWRDGLGNLQDELRRTIEPAVRLRWVRPEGVHLTLKFIGEVEAGLRPQIEAALTAAIGERPGISLRPHGLGSFGDRRALRVLWLGLDGETEKLGQLAKEIDLALHTLAFALERRPLAPHLTLARVPDGLPPESHQVIAAAIEATPPPGFGPFTFEDVALMSSQLGPGGARYQALSRFPLRAKAH